MEIQIESTENIPFYTTMLDSVFSRLEGWSQGLCLWPIPFASSCCSLEYLTSTSHIHDSRSLGIGHLQSSPEESDLLIVLGSISIKQVPHLLDVYNRMPNKKWVIAMGSCAISGGPYLGPSTVSGVDKIIPVDLFIPGCPPSPELIWEGLETFRAIVNKIQGD